MYTLVKPHAISSTSQDVGELRLLVVLLHCLAFGAASYQCLHVQVFNSTST